MSRKQAQEEEIPQVAVKQARIEEQQRFQLNP